MDALSILCCGVMSAQDIGRRRERQSILAVHVCVAARCVPPHPQYPHAVGSTRGFVMDSRVQPPVIKAIFP